MRAWKDELLQQRKGTIQKKMAKAEERRQLQIRIKAQKAHEEEAKVSQGSHTHVGGVTHRRLRSMGEGRESQKVNQG